MQWQKVNRNMSFALMCSSFEFLDQTAVDYHYNLITIIIMITMIIMIIIMRMIIPWLANDSDGSLACLPISLPNVCIAFYLQSS